MSVLLDKLYDSNQQISHFTFYLKDEFFD